MTATSSSPYPSFSRSSCMLHRSTLQHASAKGLKRNDFFVEGFVYSGACHYKIPWIHMHNLKTLEESMWSCHDLQGCFLLWHLATTQLVSQVLKEPTKETLCLASCLVQDADSGKLGELVLFYPHQRTDHPELNPLAPSSFCRGTDQVPGMTDKPRYIT